MARATSKATNQTSKSTPRPKAKPAAKAKAAPPNQSRSGAANQVEPIQFPYLHIGHGSSHCSDDFSIWLLFADEVTAAGRTAIEDAMPKPLREQARTEGGTLAWTGPLLFVNSGIDFKYFVAGYDPNHLAWVEAKLATGTTLSPDDIGRATRDVTNQDLSGPRNPSRTVWDAYNAAVELWLASVSATHRLRLVVKNVTIRDSDATPWQRWSAANALARLADLLALVRTLPPPKHRSRNLFVHPLLAAALHVTPAKLLSPEQRDACIELLGLEGLLTEPGLLADLVTSYPKDQRAAVVQQLIRNHHGAVMGLFVAAPTKLLLLDSVVYATAIEHAPHCKLPFYRWLEHRRGIPSMLTKRDAATIEWGKRLLAVIEANGELAREVREEEASGLPSRMFRSTLDALQALRARLEPSA